MMKNILKKLKIMLPLLTFAAVLVSSSQIVRAEVVPNYEPFYIDENGNEYYGEEVDLSMFDQDDDGDIASVSGLSAKDTHVFDWAGLLDEDEEESLESLCEKTGKKIDTDFIVLLVNNFDGTLASVKEDIQRARYGAVDKYNCNILFVCMGTRDIRVFSVQGESASGKWMGDALCQYIYEEIAPHFSAKKYKLGVTEYIELVEKYRDYKSSYNPNSILFKWPFQICIAAIISALITYSQAAKSKGKVTVNEDTYLKPDRDVDKDDMYLRKTITKTRIESSSGGGGGGHSGGGGGGHSGGGGGKF